jgi:hypothetical protein
MTTIAGFFSLLQYTPHTVKTPGQILRLCCTQWRGGLGGTTTSPPSSFTLFTDKKILRENPVKSYFAFL